MPLFTMGKLMAPSSTRPEALSTSTTTTFDTHQEFDNTPAHARSTSKVDAISRKAIHKSHFPAPSTINNSFKASTIQAQPTQEPTASNPIAKQYSHNVIFPVSRFPNQPRQRKTILAINRRRCQWYARWISLRITCRSTRIEEFSC